MAPVNKQHLVTGTEDKERPKGHVARALGRLVY